MKRDMGSEVLRSTGEMGEKCGQPPLLKRLLPLLAALALAGCDVLEASPYPVIKSDLVVQNRPSETIQYFGWIDNQRIVAMVIDRIEPNPDGGTRIYRSLKRWDVSSNTMTTLVDDDQIAGVCVGGGNIRYYIKKHTPESKERLEGYFGTDDAIRQTTEKGPFIPSTCELQSKYPLPDWTKNIPNPEINIRRLRPEHGFIVIDRESPRHWPRSIKLYQHEKNAPIDLPRILEGGGPNPDTLGVYPKWYSHRQAYYLPALRSGSPSWWLMPSGELEIAWQIPDGGIKLPSKTMTRTAISVATEIPVIGASDYNIETIRESGLYVLSDFNNPKRIVKGRIAQELEVSPDGCKVAFGNDDRPTIDPRKPILFHKLQVINLCPEKTQ